MRRSALTLALSSLALAALTALPTVAHAEAVTTRIETRPYYGAIVTIEQGVRVWRALPPHDRIIIAPEGTKINLNVEAAAQRHVPVAPVNTVNILNSANSYPTAGVSGFAGAGHGGRGPKIMQVEGVAPLAGPIKVRPSHYQLRPHQPTSSVHHAKPTHPPAHHH